MDTLTQPGKMSKLMPYSYGVVASNKALDSAQVEVTPLEDLNFLDGQITENMTQMHSSGQDAQGAAYQTSVNQSSTVTATWLPIGQPNRMTPPDVRRGEQVMLYRFADNTDRSGWYWTTLRNDLNLRKLETVIFGISATSNEKAKSGPENCYIFGMSSHQKKVWFHTTTADGEPHAWDIVLDTKNSVLSFEDDIGNKIVIDSDQHTVHLENADQSIIDLTKEDILVQATNSVNIKTRTFNVDSSEAINTKTTTNTFEAAQNNMNTVTNHAGDINTTSGSHGDGTVKSSGNFMTTGRMEADAGIKTQGRMEANTVYADTYENLPPR